MRLHHRLAQRLWLQVPEVLAVPRRLRTRRFIKFPAARCHLRWHRFVMDMDRQTGFRAIIRKCRRSSPMVDETPRSMPAVCATIRMEKAVRKTPVFPDCPIRTSFRR